MPSFYVQNFGCRATQADGAAIERQFEEQGLEAARIISDANIVVFNTCTVTASADQDARAAIRRVHRENPCAKIVVTGCYAQRSPEELASIPGVAKVIGNSHKHQLAEIALSQQGLSNGTFVPLSLLGNENRELRTALFVSDIFAHTELLAAPVFDAPNERTRPNLKVQDGCDNRCSFCVIPFVRGQSRSLRLERVIEEVNRLIASGYRELVISGINLGRWGRDLSSEPSEGTDGRQLVLDQRLSTNDQQLVTLVRAILNDTALEKLRISSVEPMDWTDELIQLVASSSRIAKHAHVPMQSGSDAVLRRMHRKYRPWHYREKILKIRAAMPNAAIGADVMVGFPGETEEEFAETRLMIEDLPFTYLHVFTYSARPGTPAADMPRQVPVHIARERNRVLREIGERKKLDFMLTFIGQAVEAITLANGTAYQNGHDFARPLPNDVFTEALTDNYMKLRIPGDHMPNQWMRARVSHVEHGALIAAN